MHRFFAAEKFPWLPNVLSAFIEGPLTRAALRDTISEETRFAFRHVLQVSQLDTDALSQAVVVAQPAGREEDLDVAAEGSEAEGATTSATRVKKVEPVVAAAARLKVEELEPEAEPEEETAERAAQEACDFTLATPEMPPMLEGITGTLVTGIARLPQCADRLIADGGPV